MKKFLIVVAAALVLYFAGDILFYNFGLYIDLSPGTPVRVVATSEEDTIYIAREGQWVPFEVRGVTVGTGVPGNYATDFAADYDTYLRWFGQIADMGANTVRAAMLYDNDFYDALYDHNTADPDRALYLIQGIAIKDYLLGSRREATDSEVLGRFQENARAAVDAVHGRRKTYLGRNTGSGDYANDVSPWVLAYMVGTEWDDKTIAYTNDLHGADAPYAGTYLSAREGASAFESFIANIGDNLISYESRKYKQQRLFTFASSPMTDPFEYDSRVVAYHKKIARLDIDNLAPTEAFGGGLFAAYNAVPFQYNLFDMEKQMMILDMNAVVAESPAQPALDPGAMAQLDLDLAAMQEEWARQGLLQEREALLDLPAVLRNSAAGQSDYRQYLEMLVEYHNCPVVVTEFGHSSARGTVSISWDPEKPVGAVNETEQARLMTEGLADIKSAGCAGVCLIGWQDEWDRKSWNTLEKVDLLRNLYWSDAQTANQSLGVLAMDTGADGVLCHVDGDDADWAGVPRVAGNPGAELFMQYDERFLYLMVRTGTPLAQPLYIPLDTTPKSGSDTPRNLEVTFANEADFVVVLDEAAESRLMVQRRYEVLSAVDGFEVYGRNSYADTPARGHPDFDSVNMPLKYLYYIGSSRQAPELAETGLLRQGVSDPAHPDYDSLADYCYGDSFVEIRLPWQLLNFSDPSRMAIHDDYYDNYGVDTLHIGALYAGAGYGGGAAIAMEAFELAPWGNTVSYHERLKPAYYAVAEYWNTPGQQPPVL